MLGKNSIYEWFQWMKQGYKSLFVRPSTEAAVENGKMFYFHKAFPLGDPINAGASRYIVFRTGATPVIVKSRIVAYIGEEFSIELFSDPVLSNDGTAITVSNYRGELAGSTSVQVFYDPSITTEGTKIDDEPEYYFGSSANGQRASNSIPDGRQRNLPINTTFLVKITNSGSGTGRFQYSLDWIEDTPELPYHRSPLVKADYDK